MKLPPLTHVLTSVTAAMALSTGASAGTIGVDAVHGYSSNSYLASGSKASLFRSVLEAAGHILLTHQQFHPHSTGES